MHLKEQFLYKAIAALPKNSTLHNIGSISTAGSDESSRIYESALESLNGDEDDDGRISLDLPSLSFMKKQTVDDHNLSNISSRTASPQRKQLRVAVQSPTSSTTVTPTYSNTNINVVRKKDLSNNKKPTKTRHVEHTKQFEQDEIIKQGQNNTQVQINRLNQNNELGPDNEQKQDIDQKNINGHDQSNGQEQGYMQILNNENIRDMRQTQAVNQHNSQNHDVDLALLKKMQASKYEELQKKVEMMEKQFVLDREQFSKMEDELIHNRHEMMQTLIDTKDQLNSVLKSREESKARELEYQKQMKQHQLQQLQQVASHHKQDEFANEVKGTYEDEELSDSDYYPQQKRTQQPLEVQQEFSYRRVARSKSQEYFKPYDSRSSSASIQNNQQYHHHHHHQEEDRRTLSRHNSSTSNRSNRLDPSPSSTFVGNQFPQQRRMNRPRARSIETGRWHEEHHHYGEAEMLEYHNRPRRSRSVGRRPRSRGSTVFYEDMQNEDVHFASSRYYNQQDSYNDSYYRQPQTPQQYYYNQYHAQQGPPCRQALPRYASNGSRRYSNYHRQQ